VLFVVLLAIALSSVVGWALASLAAALGLDGADQKFGLACAGALAVFAFAVGASFFVNVNRFSLHAVYRNRLIRAFLGSARAGAEGDTARTPDPFTGFDDADNPPLAALWTAGGNGGRRRLFPVINMALNVVATENLAWQERKAESFVATPLVCGNPLVGFVPTKFYGAAAKGLSLGTALAISGAAASPNQGYHSSPLVGFLMMLFNVRLGWWLGNPQRGPGAYRREGPMLSFAPLVNELAGRTTDRARYLYLSDGGHFENLGIYEMVRRRCHFILVSDAGCDPQCAFEDLGNAVRKIWIDLGVLITFERLDIAARQKPPVAGDYCAMGRIRYPEPEAEDGLLLYVKPGYHGTEPADIRSYAAAHADFPHETTGDQWFSESQMESYRALGSHIVGTLCEGTPADDAGAARPAMTLEAFFEDVRARLATAPAAP
jgi:hypothetical protein